MNISDLQDGQAYKGLPVIMPGGPGGAKVPRMGKGASLGCLLGRLRIRSLHITQAL